MENSYYFQKQKKVCVSVFEKKRLFIKLSLSEAALHHLIENLEKNSTGFSFGNKSILFLWNQECGISVPVSIFKLVGKFRWSNWNIQSSVYMHIRKTRMGWMWCLEWPCNLRISGLNLVVCFCPSNHVSPIDWCQGLEYLTKKHF